MAALDSDTLERMLAAHLERVEKVVAGAGGAAGARRHLTLKQAAEYAARSVDTLRNACLRRELKHTQTGTKAIITIALCDLDRWLEKNAVREVRR